MKNITRLSFLATTVALMLVTACSSTPTRDSTGQYLDDATITTKVKAALLDDASLKSLEFKVDTFKGTVQLSGFVRSRQDASEAIRVAQTVGGVRDVKDDMQVK
jgi:hyperosmotically inducible protein